MFLDRFHHSAPHTGPDEPVGWANTHLGYEAVMATVVATCVVLTLGVLSMPVWIR